MKHVCPETEKQGKLPRACICRSVGKQQEKGWERKKIKRVLAPGRYMFFTCSIFTSFLFHKKSGYEGKTFFSENRR
jgi:hypothetical protein